MPSDLIFSSKILIIDLLSNLNRRKSFPEVTEKQDKYLIAYSSEFAAPGRNGHPYYDHI